MDTVLPIYYTLDYHNTASHACSFLPFLLWSVNSTNKRNMPHALRFAISLRVHIKKKQKEKKETNSKVVTPTKGALALTQNNSSLWKDKVSE